LANPIPASSRRVDWRSNTPETNFRLVKVDDFRLTASTIGATLIASSPAQAGIPLRARPRADFVRSSLRSHESDAHLVPNKLRHVIHVTTVARASRGAMTVQSPHPRN
jgi:hypothetical protein